MGRRKKVQKSPARRVTRSTPIKDRTNKAIHNLTDDNESACEQRSTFLKDKKRKRPPLSSEVEETVRRLKKTLEESRKASAPSRSAACDNNGASSSKVQPKQHSHRFVARSKVPSVRPNGKQLSVYVKLGVLTNFYL